MKPVRKNVMFLPEKDCKNDSVMYNNSQKGFWPTLYIQTYASICLLSEKYYCVERSKK